MNKGLKRVVVSSWVIDYVLCDDYLAKMAKSIAKATPRRQYTMHFGPVVKRLGDLLEKEGFCQVTGFEKGLELILYQKTGE